MTKIYTISTYYGQYEAPDFGGIYSSPAMVAAYFDEGDRWDDESEVVSEHIVDGLIHDPDGYDPDGKSVPKERFKPFSRHASLLDHLLR